MANVQAIVDLIKTLSVEDQQTVINGINQFSGDYDAHVNSNPSKIENGTKYWYNEKGQLHRTDTDANGQTLPAVIWSDGTKQWWQNDQLHRTDVVDGKLQPAIVDKDGKKQYFIHGQQVKFN